MKKLRTTLAWITIVLVLFSGFLCAIHTDVSDTSVQEQLTSAVLDLAKAIVEALRKEYTYGYTFPDGIHLYIGGIGEKEDDDGGDKPHP